MGSEQIGLVLALLRYIRIIGISHGTTVLQQVVHAFCHTAFFKAIQIYPMNMDNISPVPGEQDGKSERLLEYQWRMYAIVGSPSIVN